MALMDIWSMYVGVNDVGVRLDMIYVGFRFSRIDFGKIYLFILESQFKYTESIKIF